ncbi:MAG TPA: UDP-N-acetylmuramoyl-L-alanyl-D-glutamate--2,6-diaminopimelate ligase [Blastocatellia bacterium]|nr:UDP-N-acetylmuramoyl-L-alanyl-D-glutamate--2,6-diaminopimelate ligase [Blastocatellia bacterium]
MKLSDLANQIAATATAGELNVDAADVTHDSRECLAGWIFVAIRGDSSDGHSFIRQAVERGAVAVISERQEPERAAPAWIQVRDARAALATAAAVLHGWPARSLKLVGVTGTNGKTTTAHLIDSIIRSAEGTSAIIGTIRHRVGQRVVEAQHTTPEASTTQRLLAEAVAAGCRSAVMEVSSHSIELHRADALGFEAAVFTNLTRDHLDYHRTMENYFAAKRKLFDGTLGSAPKSSIINSDDEYGRRLAKMSTGNLTTYGLSESADVRTRSFDLAASGLRFVAETPAGKVEIESRLVGRPHVYNILAAVGAGLALGFEPGGIQEGIAKCTAVPGRFERVVLNGAGDPGFAVVVDYAHTDDALKNVLQTARELVREPGRLITVFGCGGNRDRTKRAPMGETAARLSDIIFVTSDNPRGENPVAIINDIEIGLMRTGRPYLKLPDRRQAIFRAMKEARPGDIVVIAGKGHETYQVIGDQKQHFDDREVAREALSSL